MLSDEFSTESVEMQLSQYQHQSTPVPSIGNVYPALCCRNMDPLGCRHEDTGGFPHEVSQRQILDIRWWARVSNADVLQRSGLSTIGDILRHRRLSLFGHVARLNAGVLAYDDLHLIVDV